MLNYKPRSGNIGFLGTVACNKGVLYVVQVAGNREDRACRGRNLRSDGALAVVCPITPLLLRLRQGRERRA